MKKFKVFIITMLTISIAAIGHAGLLKVWYKNDAPTKVISFNKSAGNPDESFFECAYPVTLKRDKWDHDAYVIDHSGGRPVLKRKAQAVIDAAIAVKATRAAWAAIIRARIEQLRRADAIAELKAEGKLPENYKE